MMIVAFFTGLFFGTAWAVCDFFEKFYSGREVNKADETSSVRPAENTQTQLPGDGSPAKEGP